MRALENILVDKIPGIGPKRKEQLSKLGIKSIKDLLLNIPRDYIDFSKVYKLKDDLESKGLFQLRVVSQPTVRAVRGGMKILTVDVRDDSGYTELVYFNQEFLKNIFKPGSIHYIYGTLEHTRYGSQISNGEIINKTDVGKLKPIYSLAEGLYQKDMARISAQGFNMFKEYIIDYLDDTLLEDLHLIDLRSAIRGIHYPENQSTLNNSKKRLAFDELLRLKSRTATIKKSSADYPKISKCKYDNIINQFISDLPFKLTNAQSRVIDEIRYDMTSDSSMNRLLQGDVGSGKTIVSTVAILLAVLAGYQAAFMAPTEILATQQYKSLKRDLKDFDFNIGLLTGDISAKAKESIYDKLRSGSIDLIVGTHALIQEEVSFDNLGLVITDEQHRFGVKQRQELVKKGNNPHNLIMTATPIPRTLAMVLYGQMDVSVMDELPAMRKPTQTVVINQSYQNRLDNFIISEVEEGRQVFIVCPLIEDENDTDLNSLEDILDYYSGEKFEGLNVQSVHGKQKADEKRSAMDRFVSGDIDILIATTVIEVGINVPNASLMVIYDADRFGLSQLHQLRGRVGRGADDAYCVLINNNTSEKSFDRMNVMKNSENGFVIAEKDLELRGEGDLQGLRQHGVPSLSVADITKDSDLIEMINNNYDQIIESIHSDYNRQKEFYNILE